MSHKFSPDLHAATQEDIFYTLVMFPYPSGVGLHVGHASNYTINDVLARYQRLRGKTVFNPIGFDSFGLPTENFAMKVGKPAYEVTEENIAYFLKQIGALNMSFDMDRVLATSRPDYYKWTQWIFAELFKAGLVYRDELRVNWCPECQTVLANDQVIDGCCERCKSEIIQKKMPQWFIKITAYADRLLEDLDQLDWPEETKIGQRNWIGRSEGAEIDFAVLEKIITVFTTRPDTLYGVTALVLAPENTLLDDYLDDNHKMTVEQYRKATMAKTAVQRQQDSKEKTGVFSGLYASHPLNGEQVPVWYADYVLPDYATGSIMLVPGHDQRDFEFATKFSIPIIQVIKPVFGEPEGEVHEKEGCYGIVFDPAEQKYLVIAQKGDLGAGSADEIVYSFPGGTPEEGEGMSETLLREVREETGYVDITVDESVAFQNIAYGMVYTKGVFRKNNATYFACTLSSPAVVERALTEVEQGMEVLWLSKDELSRLPMHDSFRSAYEYFVEGSVATDGVLMNSGMFDDLPVEEAKSQIIAHLETLGTGKRKVTYKLRDWSVSRQRYWGSPIPVYYNETGQPQLIPNDQLPVELPLDVANYKPKGKSPLEEHPTFPDVEIDGKVCRRECDTLDTFMCSSFYFLRYVDPHNPNQLADPALLQKMFPVDFYIGGKEHTVGHLLYSRFIHKFLYDQGYVTVSEPFQKLVHQGMVLGADGRKMSKRRGNVIDPLEIIENYGADTLRTYLMFMGPVDQDKVWNDNSLKGVHKFLSRIAVLLSEDFLTDQPVEDNESMLHKTIKGITDDLERGKLNTVVSKLMIFVNHVYDIGSITAEQLQILALLLQPYAPELAAQIWSETGGEGDIDFASWPSYDPDKILEEKISLPVQINGKMRGNLEVDVGSDESTVVGLAHQVENIAKHLEGKDIKKVIYVQDKILNLVV